MSLALQVLVSGLAAGAVYGLVAVVYVLVYRLTGIVYFAFGDSKASLYALYASSSSPS